MNTKEIDHAAVVEKLYEIEKRLKLYKEICDSKAWDKDGVIHTAMTQYVADVEWLLTQSGYR